MKTSWWLFLANCSDCNEEGIFLNLGYSADGEMRMFMRCPKCKEAFEVNIFDSQLRLDALRKDMEQKQLPPAPEDFTEYDAEVKSEVKLEITEYDSNFLKSCNIRRE